MVALETENPQCRESIGATGDPRAPRATKAEMQTRIATVRDWIREDGITVEEALRRLQDAYRLGRRQAIRLWVRAYVPLLNGDERRQRAQGRRPRDRQGRYRPWPSLDASAIQPG